MSDHQPQPLSQSASPRQRIVHLTSVHRPDDMRVFRKECVSLAAAGYEVVLVAPGAEPRSEQGVRYHPVPQPNGRLHRLGLTGWRVLQAGLAERGALYHFHDPELIPMGIILRCLGKKVVYDVHEDVPAQVRSKFWLPAVLRGAIAQGVRGIQWVGLRLFNGVVAAGEDVAEGLGGSGVTVLRNYPLLAEFHGLDGPPYRERAAEVVHVGNLLRIRASRELIEAIALVPVRLAPELVLAGDFADDGLETEVRALPGWNRTRYLGWTDRAQVAARLARAKVGVVMFGPHPNHYAVRSNKLFEYMAAGLPVVGPDFPAWRALIERVRCGLVADPTDPAAIAAAITTLLEDPVQAEAMGRRGRAAVVAEFNWEAEFHRLLGLYQQILGVGAPSGQQT